MGRIVFQYIDFDSDKTQVSVLARDGAQASYDADVTDVTDLIAAINGVTIGNNTFWAWEAERNETGAVAPASPLAQTNIQFIAEASDDVTGETFRVRIPTADLALATSIVGGVATVPLGAGAGLALKTAWDAVVLSPEGNASTLQSLYFRE